MKKIYMLILSYLCVIVLAFTVEVRAADFAETDYQSFVEIMLTSGKLLKNFTSRELDELLPKTDGTYFFQAVVYPVTKNVQASYISNTLFSVHNKSNTDITYDVDVQVEMNNKVTFSSSGQISGSTSGTINKVKAEASAKSGVEYSNSTTISRKEKQTMKITVEAGSRCIVYLTGNLTVNNGVCAVYEFFYRSVYGGYEFVTLESQYAKVEKVKIWKRFL